MRQLSLHTRVSLVLTAVAASLLLVLAGLWLRSSETAIHEEVEAATRVSSQMLGLLVREVKSSAELVDAVQPLGRIRSHELWVSDAAGTVLYHSPASVYKQGRQAPAWFSAALAPAFAPRMLAVGGAHLVLQPDPSRAVLDAWDEALRVTGWALVFLGVLFLAARRALAVALRPLDSVMAALEKTGRGRFDVRLPVFATPELASVSRAFNGMADRLRAAVDDNVRLETEHELAACIQSRLENERQEIARELHDELAQGVTAVRALAGAIVQRSSERPEIHGSAQAIVAVTGEMQAGVRNILHRLRPLADAASLPEWLDTWALRHPQITLVRALTANLDQLPGSVGQTVVRLVQEGLTNVLRHARASRVEVCITEDAGGLHVRVSDDGRGPGGSTAVGCGLGLNGMRERVALLGGTLKVAAAPAGGFSLDACLPNVKEWVQ
ncbi:MAG: histidine kinase [Azonexus sp.]|nr:histidine kinase [Azonexus sp.]